jgi:hypothetical protein
MRFAGHLRMKNGKYSWVEPLKKKEGENMDEKIKKLQKDTKKLEKEENSLLKADKKRDKVCEYGEKEMKKHQR